MHLGAQAGTCWGVDLAAAWSLTAWPSAQPAGCALTPALQRNADRVHGCAGRPGPAEGPAGAEPVSDAADCCMLPELHIVAALYVCSNVLVL